jgi:hypothetical protein
MKTLSVLFIWGIILILGGLSILLGATIYEAFQKSLEWGFQVMGFLVLIIGIALASIVYLIAPTLKK